MNDKPSGFFVGTEMPTAGWWEALWPDPAGVLVKMGLKSDMDVILMVCIITGMKKLCSSEPSAQLSELHIIGIRRAYVLSIDDVHVHGETPIMRGIRTVAAPGNFTDLERIRLLQR